MNIRTDSTIEYLKALEKSFQVGWSETFTIGEKTVFEKLALLHPLHIKELDLPSHQSVEKIQESFQGPRRFSKPLGGNSCQSALLWGYDCELKGELQQDHLFPYSLGGPTFQTNRIFLCNYHNMVKSSDIHCYPWDSIDSWTEPWLDSQIDRLNREIFKLYS